MTQDDVKRTLNTPSQDLWDRTLFQIQSVYGRLAYLGKVRDADSGLYRHHGMEAMFGEEASDRAIRESHTRCFREWLSMDLVEQKADFELFLAEQAGDSRGLIENWLRLSPYRNAIPVSASRTDRQLFVGEFEQLLLLLRGEMARRC